MFQGFYQQLGDWQIRAIWITIVIILLYFLGFLIRGIMKKEIKWGRSADGIYYIGDLFLQVIWVVRVPIIICILGLFASIMRANGPCDRYERCYGEVTMLSVTGAFVEITFIAQLVMLVILALFLIIVILSYILSFLASSWRFIAKHLRKIPVRI